MLRKLCALLLLLVVACSSTVPQQPAPDAAAPHMGLTGVVFLQRIADGTGTLAPAERAFALPSGWTITDVPSGSLAGTVGGPGQVTGYSQLVAPAGVTPTTAKGIATTGNGTATLFSYPVPTNSAAAFRLSVAGQDGTYGTIIETSPTLGVTTIGGSPAFPGGSLVIGVSQAPIPPSVPNPSWAAGVLTITVQGPQATVTSAANNGSGKVRLTVGLSEGMGLTSALSAKSVTISGLTTCTEANGTNIATYVDSTHLDLAAVAIVHTGADSGTVVLATPPVWTWSASLTLLASP